MKSLSRILLVSLFALASACGGGHAATPTANNKPLTPYTGRAAALFDDSILPAAVGLDLEQEFHAKTDKVLRERAQMADGIFRARLATVTKKQEEAGTSYELALRSVEKLAGNAPGPDEFFVVKVQKDSPAIGILKSFESRLVGKEFIALVKRFSRPGGEPEVHVHLAPSSNEVRAAISDAVALEAVQ